MELLRQARKALIAATADDHLNRDAVLEWYRLKTKARGEEAELIGETAEALMVAAGPEDVLWLQDLLRGGPVAAEREALRQRMQDEAFTFAPEAGPRDIGNGMVILDEVGPLPRGDASDGEDEQGAEEEDLPIDWANVDREVKVMLALNPQAQMGEDAAAGGGEEG